MTAPTEGARKPPVPPASVKIAAAKGRPMLSWVGKRPLREVRAFPAQLIERFGAGEGAEGAIGPSEDVDWSGWPDRYERGGLLFHGDNKEVLAHLLASGFRGKVDLVYIDPPFDSGADYVRRVHLRGASGTAQLEGETYTLGEQIQYTDIWANDSYLQFMYERLLLLKELLSVTGSLYLHCDWRKAHHLRMLLDEIFGTDAFRASITWRSMTSSGYKGKASLGRSHADILYYSKSAAFQYQPVLIPMSPGMRARYRHQDPDGRLFKDSYLGDVSPQTLAELESAGLLFRSGKGKPRIKHYLDEAQGVIVDDVWTDIDVENSQAAALTGFPTQKPEALLDRIVRLSSNPGDIVLDCFIGSGTTAAVAQKLGRRWIGADINKGAIQTVVKRLADMMEEQSASVADGQQKVFEETEDDRIPPLPAQLSFKTWRVNDYDLQIQHNEAVYLACEHLGVERTKTDRFFDGTLGRELAKIVPFNHPATVLDLQEAARELESRPGEERDVVLVALGRELATEHWLEEHNRHRPVNKLRIVELRTDPKYGQFFEHRPASARVRLDGSRVVIEDFISPSILERLRHTDGVVAPQITDWRSMVDSVMIDTAYDGEVFNVALADIPERKSDLVAGDYGLELAESADPIAVKITDMLGEEVLIVISRD